MKNDSINSFSIQVIISALKGSFLKLSPFEQVKNPVMFVTYLGAIFSTYLMISQMFTNGFESFNFQVTLWLWFTVLFANFASALAEGRGKAQAESLRKAKIENVARKLDNEKETVIPATQLKKGDLIVCQAGDIIAADGEVVEGIATVDESAITGESAPVIRESGGDRSAVTAGTRIVSDRIVVLVTSESGNSFLDRMIGLIEGAERKKTPNEIALSIILSALTMIFILSVISLKAFAEFSASVFHENLSNTITPQILIALLVCLIPTTISALLNAIGIAGMDRLISRNVIAKSGRAVEAAGDIDLLLLDKTGTITLGNRMASEFIPSPSSTEEQVAQIAQLSSLADETPEGRSIVVLAKEKFNLRAESLDAQKAKIIPFSAQNRMSGIDFLDEQGNVYRSVRKGAVEAIKTYIEKLGGDFPAILTSVVEDISKKGGTPLLVTDQNVVLGAIYLKDIIKGGIKERFEEMRKMGIRTVMITGDNALTAAAIAVEAGVDDYRANATPEIKLNLIREEQKLGHLIAMTGDGTNDAPALAQADVGVAMNTGTQASREAGNMVDLDSNPTKLIEIVEIGKQLLMTRGALTTFSIANDVAKYFAIIPPLFSQLYHPSREIEGPLSHLNIMGFDSHQSAILSAIIFNAIIIVILIPLALKGVAYRPESAQKLLKHNLLVYGLGGLIAPFIGIKVINIIIHFLGLT